MGATTDLEMDSLLTGFDQIYEDFKSGMVEIQFLTSNCNTEIKKRESLEANCLSLKLDNERLTKLYTESLNNIAEQLEYRIEWQSLKEEVKRLTAENLRKEEECRKTIELLKQDYATKIGELKNQVSVLLLEKATSEATMNQLRQDLAAHKTHMQNLANRLQRVHFDVESKYNVETQDLKDCLMVEYEEKNELTRKVQDLEKELLISKTKLVEKHQDFTSNRLVETLRMKLMKLRKENGILKRKLSNSEEGSEGSC
ncbi:protein At-4/1 [Euphorbia lathyris]|uniref:protein At-4/1 n=1 Tax=Euphorbia lathyris TaxID=212925 RepID=UPI003313C22D